MCPCWEDSCSLWVEGGPGASLRPLWLALARSWCWVDLAFTWWRWAPASHAMWAVTVLSVQVTVQPPIWPPSETSGASETHPSESQQDLLGPMP